MQLRLNWLLILLPMFLLAIVFSGCVAQSTPPGAAMFSGGIEQSGYLFLHWKEGLKVMIWYDRSEGSMCHSSSSSTDPVYRVECYAGSEDDHRIDWKLHTLDGQSAQFWINQISYDLSQGALFIITTTAEETEIIQLQRNLSDVQPDHDNIINFATKDPDVARFIKSQSNARTDIEAVDTIIEIILNGDIEARKALVRYTTSACTTANGLGGPPKCEPDEVDGTLVKTFPVLESEGHHVRPEFIEDTLGFVVDNLYAVYRVPDETYQTESWPVGEYGLVFVRDENDYLVTITVHVENGKIVRIDYDVGKPPAMVIEQKTGELLLPPILPATSVSQDEVTLADPMKGYELYSWQIQRDWYFALVVGTNRIKSYDEISSPEVSVRGLAALKSKLAQLPAGEQLFWSAQRVPNTVLPPQEMIDQIRAYCEEYGIQLSVVAGN